MPRLGSRVRIPSPAPVFINKFNRLSRSRAREICFPVPANPSGKQGGSTWRRFVEPNSVFIAAIMPPLNQETRAIVNWRVGALKAHRNGPSDHGATPNSHFPELSRNCRHDVRQRVENQPFLPCARCAPIFCTSRSPLLTPCETRKRPGKDGSHIAPLYLALSNFLQNRYY